MNPLNRMNPGVVVTCSLGDDCKGTLTCHGVHTRIEGPGDYTLTTDQAIAIGAYPKQPARIERPVSADEAVEIIQHAYTGNGYGVAINPLLEEPATIDEHVSLIRARGASLERWTSKPEFHAKNGPVIREIIARMEGNLQALRTLVKDIEKAETE